MTPCAADLGIEVSGVLDVPLNDMRYDTGAGLGARLALFQSRNGWEFGGIGFLEALDSGACLADAPCYSGKHRLGGGGVLLRRRFGSDNGTGLGLEAGAGYSDRWWHSDAGERATSHSSGAFVSAGLSQVMTRSMLGLNTLAVGVSVLPRDDQTGVYATLALGRTFRVR